MTKEEILLSLSALLEINENNYYKISSAIDQLTTNLEKNTNHLSHVLPAGSFELLHHLSKAGIYYDYQLTEMTKKEVSDIYYIGKASLKKIEDALSKRNLCLKGE